MVENKSNPTPPNICSMVSLSPFHVFRLEPILEKNNRPTTYRAREHFKITLVKGGGVFHYADKSVVVEQQAIAFSNPQIPYSWERRDQILSGFFCIFTPDFFNQFGNIHQYDLFKPNGTHIFELTIEDFKRAAAIFEKMFLEIQTDYVYKYDVLRNMAFELIHLAMKLQPSHRLEPSKIDASNRITALFLELLERQFPINENNPQIKIRSASEFAHQLSIHVNHLNRSVKAKTQQTTTHLIAQRILQEAKALLKHSNWNVSEIAHSLGFEETSHFNNFFKKNVEQTPLQYRNI
jgi:AraC family transcriptional regulator, transcriptional activator of pobA